VRCKSVLKHKGRVRPNATVGKIKVLQGRIELQALKEQLNWVESLVVGILQAAARCVAGRNG
jgi:hypothetical protein